MMHAGERSARVLLELDHSDEAIIRCLTGEVGLTRGEAIRAIGAARHRRNREAWAPRSGMDAARSAHA